MRAALARLIKTLVSADPEPKLLDHVPVGSDAYGPEEMANEEANERDRVSSVRSKKLHEALKRHGRPFKCAARDLPGDVMVVKPAFEGGSGIFVAHPAGRPPVRTISLSKKDRDHGNNVAPLRRKP